MTGFAQLVFPDKANGSLIEVDGRVVGSKLVAPGVHEPALLPLAAVGDGAGLQRGRHDVREPRADEPRPRQGRPPAAQAILKLERPYNPGLTIGDIPVDAVTTSGSGIDPQISPAYARLQAARIASVRGLSSRPRAASLIDDEHRRAARSASSASPA